MKRFLTIFLSLAGWLGASAIDVTVDDCRRMALDTDESLKIAENNLTGSGLDRGVAFTQYLPKLAGSATGIYQAPDTRTDLMTMQLRGAYMAGINLTQPVYAGGKIAAGNRMARVGERISREQLRAARQDVIADVEQAYWTYVAVLAKVDMTRQYLAMMDSLHAMAEVSVSTGMAPGQALLRVDARRSEVVYRLSQAEAGADVCRMALCRCIGVADTTHVNPMGEPEMLTPLPSLADGVELRPETKILEQMIELKKADVAMTRGDFLPTVGLQVGWSAYGNIRMKSWTQDAQGNPIPLSTNFRSDGFMGMLAVQVPLFHWGEGLKKVRKAKLEVENARLTLERSRRLMMLEASQQRHNVDIGAELVASAETAMREADENLRLMRQQYEVGLTTLTDLLEAQSQWQASHSNLIEARTQRRIDAINYLRAIGLLE